MKLFKLFTTISTALLIICISLFVLQQHNIKEFITDYWFPPKGKVINDYKIIRCDYAVFTPQVAFVSDQVILDEFPEIVVYFSELSNTFFGAIHEDYLGSATIKNTTFPQLVQMVKEDCGQFKEGYLDYTGYEDLSEQEKYDRYYEIEEKNLGWTYTPYTPEPEKQPEPELTDEEKARNEAWEEQMRQATLENRANAAPIEDLYK